jgi:hypothetical protein
MRGEGESAEEGGEGNVIDESYPEYGIISIFRTFKPVEFDRIKKGSKLNERIHAPRSARFNAHNVVEKITATADNIGTQDRASIFNSGSMPSPIDFKTLPSIPQYN